MREIFIERDELLLRIAIKENGKLVESEKRTGRWAWKHIHQADGSVE